MKMAEEEAMEEECKVDTSIDVANPESPEPPDECAQNAEHSEATAVTANENEIKLSVNGLI